MHNPVLTLMPFKFKLVDKYFKWERLVFINTLNRLKFQWRKLLHHKKEQRWISVQKTTLIIRRIRVVGGEGGMCLEETKVLFKSAPPWRITSQTKANKWFRSSGDRLCNKNLTTALVSPGVPASASTQCKLEHKLGVHAVSSSYTRLGGMKRLLYVQYLILLIFYNEFSLISLIHSDI